MRRRGFLKALGVGAAGAALIPLLPAQPVPPLLKLDTQTGEIEEVPSFEQVKYLFDQKIVSLDTAREMLGIA